MIKFSNYSISGREESLNRKWVSKGLSWFKFNDLKLFQGIQFYCFSYSGVLTHFMFMFNAFSCLPFPDVFGGYRNCYRILESIEINERIDTKLVYLEKVMVFPQIRKTSYICSRSQIHFLSESFSGSCKN